MKLTDEQYSTLVELLDNAKESSPAEIEKLAISAPGVYKVKGYVSGKTFRKKYYSLTNDKLKAYCSGLVNQDPKDITTMHQAYYGLGGENHPHLDKATFTLVIMLDADLKEGGDFYLKGEYQPEFKKKGEYITYNGGTDEHSVTKILNGWREVFVVWWFKAQKKSII